VFSVAKPHPDIYLVARIEKILQGAVNAGTEPYCRTPSVKDGTKIFRQVKAFCQVLGTHKTPFAWGYR
jgi:hypothetical protein